MYVVICRDDNAPDGSPGPYVASTRTLFASEGHAFQYMKGVAVGREPRIVSPDEYLCECSGWKVRGSRQSARYRATHTTDYVERDGHGWVYYGYTDWPSGRSLMVW